MTKIWGCRHRIERKQWQIDQHIKYRGSSGGTFWQDLPAVDAAIEELKKELKELEKELKNLTLAKK